MTKHMLQVGLIRTVSLQPARRLHMLATRITILSLRLLFNPK
jgi:hypothetical protein